ncbi:MAG TPA: hypothetical protein VF037_04310 [Gemmatimonadales bacterium]
MSAPHRILGIAAGLAAAAAIAAGSAAPVPLYAPEAARIRLSWSARPERIETCRTLSEAELAARPEHMRQRTECEGRFATYALEVTVDGRQLEATVLTGGGLRSDRPIHYLNEFDVAPGARAVRIALLRREAAVRADHEGEDEDDSPPPAARADRERIERRRREETALPPAVVLDTVLDVSAGQVAVITFDPVTRRFTRVRR